MTQRIVSSETLLKIAGKERFQRGLQASKTHKVTNFQSKDSSVTAEVQGHHVTLRYKGELVEGACDCADSDGFEFCHHCVQVTLHANKIAQQLLSLSKGPDKSKILAFLLGQEKQALAKQLLELLEENTTQFERFLLKASLENGQCDFTELRAQITEITRPQKSLFSQRQVKHYLSRIERFLIELEASNYLHEPDAMFKLVEYFIARTNALLDVVNDSWDYQHEISQSLARLYLALFERQEGRLLTRVKRFEKLFLNDRHSILGRHYAPYLQGNSKLVGVFEARLQTIWARKHFAKHSDALAQPTLPELTNDWQWRNIASYLVALPVPDGLKDVSSATWMFSLRECLAQSSEAYMSWYTDLIKEQDTTQALAVIQQGLKAFPDSERLLEATLTTLTKDKNIEALKRLVAAYPLEAGQAFYAHREQFGDQALRGLTETYAQHFKAVGHKQEMDDRPAQAHALMLDLYLALTMHDEAVAFVLKDPQLVKFERRIELAKLLDKTSTKSAIKIRESLLGDLLAKEQNRADYLAAEVLAALQKNYRQQGLGDRQLDLCLAPLESLIRKRPNFTKLARQYCQV